MKLFALLALMIGSHAMADVGWSDLLNCQSSRGSFLVRRTAVPTLLQGILSIEGQTTLFNCKAEELAQGSSLRLAYDCLENRGGNGRLRAHVTGGGYAGFTSVQLTIESMYPLPPTPVETLICQ